MPTQPNFNSDAYLPPIDSDCLDLKHFHNFRYNHNQTCLLEHNHDTYYSACMYGHSGRIYTFQYKANGLYNYKKIGFL